jgi:MFS family permease
MVERHEPRDSFAEHQMSMQRKNPAAGRYPIAAAALALLLVGTFIPSPLYELYRRQWSLSPAEISIVFGVYAASLIPTLLFLGGISDYIGRRKTLLIAFGVQALGSFVFAFALGLWWLILARILQGVAIGIGAGTATAAIREWMDESTRPRAGAITLIGVSSGAALGALIGGILAQYGPHPTMLPYLIYIALLACIAAVVTTVPSCPHLTSAAHHGLPMIDPAIRRPLFVVSVASFITWGTFAIFVSLLPTYLIRSLNVHNLLVGAFVVVALQIGMVAAPFLGRALTNRAGIIVGMAALGGGMWMLLIAVPYHAYTMMVAATLMVGFGGGSSNLAALNVVNAIAPPEHRAEVTSAYFVACYLGFSVPAIGVGLAANYVGLYVAIISVAMLLTTVAVITISLTTDRNLKTKPLPAI